MNIEKRIVLNVIKSEPEMPGEMSENIKSIFLSGDINKITEVCREIVRSTKKSIYNRIQKI